MTATQRIAAITIVFCLHCCYSHAIVILDDAAISNSPFTSLVLTKSIPPGQGLFAIGIQGPNGAEYTFSYAGIAEEYALFAINPGVELTPAYVSGHTPTVSNNGIDPGSAAIEFSIFQSQYFGYWDDRNEDGTPDSSDNYGWAEITRTGAGFDLVVSQSATAVGGGIIIGSTTQIPELSTRSLIIGCTLLLAATFRRKSMPMSS